jgi:membrane protease YdiL (CAAX protease family)
MAHTTAAVIATMLVVLLVAVQPLRGRQRYRRLVAELATNPDARRRFYARGIAASWVAVGVVAVIGALAGRGPASIRLTLQHLGPDAPLLIVLYVGVAAVALGGSLIVLWRGSQPQIDRFRRQLRGFVAIIPRTRVERMTFAMVAVTAGICEEILYRGFGIAYVRWLHPSAGSALLVVVLGSAFGIAHLYQGPRGVVLTGLIGGFFTWITLLTGTLLPAILIHVLVDLRVVALPPTLTDPVPAPR